MDWCTVIFVTDGRQQAIAKYLPGCVTTLEWKDEECESKCLEILNEANCVVLPTPINKLTKREDIAELLKENVRNCSYIFGGIIDESWKSRWSQQGISCIDFMDDEIVAMENAKITAEATIAEMLMHGDYSICGQKVIVTGYGRCGKALASLLHAMGANVTVLARSKAARQQARLDGHNAVDFSYGPEEMYGAYSVINTVPACVVTETLIAEMHKDTIIYDIASLPGGTDLIAATAHQIRVIPALGLPAKYTTKSSAKILAEAIQRHVLPKRGMREGKSWIFQIII